MRSVRDNYGGRRIALLEVKSGYTPNRIDLRLIGVKRIILENKTHIERGIKKLNRLHNEYANIAKKFEQYWPAHFMLKEYHKARDSGQLKEKSCGTKSKSK